MKRLQSLITRRRKGSVDAELAEAQKSLASGAKYFIGGHGGLAEKAQVEFKITYLHGQRLGELLESGFIFDILVRDSRELGDHRIDGLLRIDQLIAALLLTIGMNLDVGNLDDTILDKVKTSGLQIKDDQRFLQIQSHV